MSGRAWPGWLAVSIGAVWLLAEWNDRLAPIPIPGRSWGEQSLIELVIVLVVLGLVFRPWSRR